MAVDNGEGSQQLQSLASYGQVYFPAYHFTNPWVNNTSGAQPPDLYRGLLASASALETQQTQHTTRLAIPSDLLSVTVSGPRAGSTLSCVSSIRA